MGIHQVVLGCFRGLCRLGYSVAASTIYCRVCCLGHCCLLVFQKAIEAATGAGVEAEGAEAMTDKKKPQPKLRPFVPAPTKERREKQTVHMPWREMGKFLGWVLLVCVVVTAIYAVWGPS